MATREKTGGRKAGTPNKVSGKVRQILAQITEDYYTSEKFMEDIGELEPKDRIQAMEKFTSYVVPRLQSATLDMAVESKRTIEDRLKELSGED